jgi:hydroxyacylglutathione hydrolase
MHVTHTPTHILCALRALCACANTAQGHTQDHVLYFAECDAQSAVFTGDTVFVAGCGRFFEGTAEEMHQALRKFASLPSGAFVFVGHEYTVANLKFCVSVDESPAIAARLQWAQQLRSENRFTVPSTVEDEKQTNVFVRACLVFRLHTLANAYVYVRGCAALVHVLSLAERRCGRREIAR